MTSAGHHSMLGGVKLPYDHRVEYLESTGTQYIRLSNSVYGIDITASHVENAGNYGICGCWNGGSQANTIRYSTILNRGWSVTNRNNNGNIYSGSLTQTAVTRFTVNGSSVTINDTPYSMGEGWSYISTLKGFGLFGCTSGDSFVVRKGRIYCATLYDSNGNMIYDFVPVRKSGVGYLYDNLSGLLTGNQGAGAFGVGSDVSAASGGGYKRQCVRRSYKRSWRPSARFWQTPRRWEVAA